jgi:hypothetical protein
MQRQKITANKTNTKFLTYLTYGGFSVRVPVRYLHSSLCAISIYSSLIQLYVLQRKASPGVVGQDRTGQERTGQDRTGEDMTDQYRPE